MIANRILSVALSIAALVLLPLQICSTLVLGWAVKLSFGLLLLSISLIWSLLLAPLLAGSRCCRGKPVLREVVGILLLPVGLLGSVFVALMPSMGEMEGRAAKLMLCDSWPFTWECWLFLKGRLVQESPDGEAFMEFVERRSRRDKLMQRVIMRVERGEALDAEDGLNRAA
jgi:hypothetical protein